MQAEVLMVFIVLVYQQQMELLTLVVEVVGEDLADLEQVDQA